MGDRYCSCSVPISTGHYHYHLKVVLGISFSLWPNFWCTISFWVAWSSSLSCLGVWCLILPLEYTLVSFLYASSLIMKKPFWAGSCWIGVGLIQKCSHVYSSVLWLIQYWNTLKLLGIKKANNPTELLKLLRGITKTFSCSAMVFLGVGIDNTCI